LLDFDEALRQLLALARPPEGVETLPTQAALDRVLATDQVSGLDVPSMDNAQMDGWAVRIADLRAGTPLPVSQRIPAGAVAAPLGAGSVARIFTCAMLPEGADAVVMQEQAEADGDRVRFPTPPAPGEWVRRTGEDIRRGAVILPAGTRLSPQALGLAASVGLELPFLECSVAAAAAYVATVLPISIGGHGVREGALLATLAALDLVAASGPTRDPALLLATSVWAVTIACSLIGGVTLLFWSNPAPANPRI
jgi:hypothetical protein